MRDRRLVPVSDSSSLRDTVAYAVQDALERSTEDGWVPAIHFVYPLSERSTPAEGRAEVDEAAELLERVALWATEDLGDDAGQVTVETELIGTDEYLFTPGDYADVLVRYAEAHDIDAVLFDPGYTPHGTTPLLPPVTSDIQRAGIETTTAPIGRERRSLPLAGDGTIGQFLSLFGVSFVFYLVLAGSTAPFELATGAITAAIVATVLARISFTAPIDLGRATVQLGRLALYVPYLLWEITKTNVELAYIVLHPELPIDPEIVEFEAAVWSDLAVTTLANGITLTPGDLTVDVTESHFTVHVLTPADRENLLAGTLERPVRFVFYGRSAARGPTPAERRELERDRRDHKRDEVEP